MQTMSIGKKLRQLRDERNLSRKALQDLTRQKGGKGVSYQTVWNIEEEKTVPDTRTLCELAKALDVPLSDLLD